MKKMNLTLFMLILFLFTNIVMATESENITVIEDSEEEIVISDVGEREDKNLEEEIQEVVKADKGNNIMLFDRELAITGEAKDLIMAAGSKITSKALGSYAFMAATQLDISGEIFKDTFAVGNEIEVNGNIGRDFYALGNSVSISGMVERDVYAGGEELNITGIVEGDVNFVGESIFIASDAIIHGDLNLNVGEIEIRNGATIDGVVHYKSETNKIEIPEGIKTKITQVETEEKSTENLFMTKIKDFLWWTVANILLFLVMKLLFPGLLAKIRDIYVQDTVQKCCSSFGWGLLSLLIIPIISFLLIFTFIGSAIGFIGVLLYIVAYIVATAITGWVFANAFLQEKQNQMVKGILGILIVEVLRRLPIIGWFFGLMVNAIAFGTIMKLIVVVNQPKKEA